MMRMSGLKRVWAALALVAALSLNMGSGSLAYELKKDKLAQVKKVAIFSIYGPEKIQYGVGVTALQPSYDALEEPLIQGLKAKNIEAIPLEQSQQLLATAIGMLAETPPPLTANVDWQKRADTQLAAEFVTLYMSFLREDIRNFYKQNPGVPLAVMQGWNKLIASWGESDPKRLVQGAVSSHTVYIPVFHKLRIDTELGGEELALQTAALKTLGKLAQKLNADAFVVLRAYVHPPAQPGSGQTFREGSPGQIFCTTDMAIWDINGEIIFRDHSPDVVSRELTGVSLFNLSPDSGKVNALATDLGQALLKLSFMHLNDVKAEFEW